MNATFRQPVMRPAVTRLRLGRLLLLLGLGALVLCGGTLWLFKIQGHPLVTPITDSTAWPAWLKQPQVYAVPETPPAPVAPAPPVDQTGVQLAALRAELERQRQELDALKKRPAGTTIIHPQQAQAARVVPPPVSTSMLYVSHEVKEGPPPPKATEYTLAPGATKLPCIVETAMNSDVEGYFTAKVSTNVYDTATGRHLLVPQGSTILGQDQSQALLYGNERLPTISLTLALPDGRSVDLGHAPVTDQQGVAGLTGHVDQHFWRLFGAVFIGGALRGGTQALQVGLTQAGAVGQVAGGIGGTANQATQQRLGRALDTRPTITVASGQLCQVLLIKPLTLPALWH
jgi:type IV secretory pathway VirB10-like protein